MTFKESHVANTTSRMFPPGPADAGERLSNAAEQVRQSASDAASQAADAIDAQRRRAAGGLDAAADALHANADRLPGGEGVKQFARDAADRIGATADYVRSHDVGDMVDDVTDYVKANPVPALIGALALGFFAGWMLRRG